MLKAYCSAVDFNQDCKRKLELAGVSITTPKKGTSLSEDELIELIKTIDILIIGIEQQLTDSILKTINKPKIIATMSIGLDHIAKSYFESPYITVINCPTGNVTAVADHALALILNLKKRIIESNELILNRKNQRELIIRPHDIRNLTFGFLGAGKITREEIRLRSMFCKCFNLLYKT